MQVQMHIELSVGLEKHLCKQLNSLMVGKILSKVP